MKICVAQTKPARGDIGLNIDNHLRLIRLAVSHAAHIIVFPELSLTGYEPELAKELATGLDDSRLDIFQEISDSSSIIIGAGLPIRTGATIAIGMVVFQPHQPRQTYLKQYLHTDEEPYFTGASCFTGLLGGEARIALAICYELSIPEHAAQASRNGAKVYMASVSKLIGGIDKAIHRLSEIASSYSMTVLMSNQVGLAEGQVCAGKTSVWNKEGLLAGQLDDTQEGILIIDTDTQEVMKEYIDQARKPPL